MKRIRRKWFYRMHWQCWLRAFSARLYELTDIPYFVEQWDYYDGEIRDFCAYLVLKAMGRENELAEWVVNPKKYEK